MTKPTKSNVRPAKTQISQSFLHADSEDSDQAGRTCHFVGFVMRRLTLLLLAYEKLIKDCLNTTAVRMSMLKLVGYSSKIIMYSKTESKS